MVVGTGSLSESIIRSLPDFPSLGETLRGSKWTKAEQTLNPPILHDTDPRA